MESSAGSNPSSEASFRNVVSQDANQQFALLLDVMREINQGTSLERAIALVATALRQIFNFDRFAVVLTAEDGSLRLTEGHGLSEEYRASIQRRIGEGAGARALAERRPLWIPDAPNSEEFSPFQQAASEEGFRSVLILPLFLGIAPLGYLIMYHDDVRNYTTGEVVLAQALAQQAAFAVQNARTLEATEAHRRDLEQRFQQRVAEAAAIDHIVLRISSSLELGSTLQSVAEAAATLSGARYSSIWLRVTSERYHVMASYGVPLERLQSFDVDSTKGLIGRIRELRKPVQVTDFLNEGLGSREARQEVTRIGARATLGVPMMQGDDVLGALYVSRDDDTPFTDETVVTLQRLTAFAQVALQNARRFTDVQDERSRLQAYLDAIPEGVMVFDRDEHVLMVNASLRREWGVRTPMVGMRREEVFRLPQQYSSRPLRFRFDTAAVFQRVVATGDPEQGMVELDDSSRVFAMHFSALRRGDTTEGIVASIRDVTVPLELGRERSRSHLLAELLNLSASLNSELSIATLTERVVEAAMALVGTKSGTLGLIERDRLVFRRFHRPEGWVDFDMVLRSGEGAPGYVWQTLRPYVSNDCESDPHVLGEVQSGLGFKRIVTVPMLNRAGNLIGTLGVYDPIVERDFGQADVESLQLLAHQAAIAIENARLSELKDEFLSIVSHELKTPVTSIKGFAQVLKRRLSPEVLQQSSRYLDVIDHQSDRLTGLINHLLDLSRIQTGRFRFDLMRVDYSFLVRDVVSEMRLLAQNSTFTITVPDRVTVYGNAERLRQVLVNLIDNSVKHGPVGGRITITVQEEEEGVVTCVSDEGLTLPAEEAERIFQPYYQVRPEAESHQAKGLGLGLFISRQIIEEHRGRIWLSGDGCTTFCFVVSKN